MKNAKTTIKLQEKGNIRIIAHRGLSGLQRENTCEAFVAAAKRSYYGIETDIRVTKDGKFVLFHDKDLSRIFGQGGKLNAYTQAELRALRMTDLNGVRRPELQIPLLSEFLAICRRYGKQAVLEIKEKLTREKVKELIELVRKENWLKRTTFISFHKKNLLYVRAAYPQADLQYLSKRASFWDMRFMLKNRIDADIRVSALCADTAKTLHDASRKINVWTIDDKEKFALAMEYGADFVTTNILE